MEPVSRRSFLAVTAGAAGTAALLAATPDTAGAVGSDKKASGSKPTSGSDVDTSGVIVHVRNGRSGEIAIYSDDSEVLVTDKNLAEAIARAAKGKR
jgi:hypothetical protein